MAPLAAQCWQLSSDFRERESGRSLLQPLEQRVSLRLSGGAGRCPMLHV
jgi:hypothetical protein